MICSLGRMETCFETLLPAWPMALHAWECWGSTGERDARFQVAQPVFPSPAFLCCVHSCLTAFVVSSWWSTEESLENFWKECYKGIKCKASVFCVHQTTPVLVLQWAALDVVCGEPGSPFLCQKCWSAVRWELGPGPPSAEGPRGTAAPWCKAHPKQARQLLKLRPLGAMGGMKD